VTLDRYPADVLAVNPRAAPRSGPVAVTVCRDLVVEDARSGWCGAVVSWENGLVALEDRHGRRKSFRLGPGFLLDGRPVALRPPARPAPTAPNHTASGSLRGPGGPARVARASRLWVEGLHDAELIEKVWGDDLRHIGVVTESLGGIDRLAERVADFGPGPARRLGVLVDHLNPGTKESRLADAVRGGPWADHVLVLGHRYVDVWQAVNPAAVGLTAWPDVPRGVDWKTGLCQALGWPARSRADLARAWRRIRGSVTTWRDLDQAFVVTVERLIDFVQEAAG